MRFQNDIQNVAGALTLSPEQAAPAVATFDKESRNKLHAFYRDRMPSLTKVNESGREVMTARERLLAALK